MNVAKHEQLARKQAANAQNELDFQVRELTAGIQAYQQRLERQILEYRNQRAWQVMLAIRKAYTLLLCRGWRGKGEFLQWVLGDLPKGNAGLVAYDLTFPDIRDFMPETALRATASAPLSLTSSAEPVAQSRASAHQYDVVMLPIFDFEFRFQRPQQLAMQFARAGHRVFWVSPSRMLSSASSHAYEISPVRNNIWEVNLRGPKLHVYTGSLSPENAETLALSIRRLWSDAAIAEACVFIQFPFWRKLGTALKVLTGAPVVYDCMDDWQNWPTEPLISEANLADERSLVREADLLLVTATALMERHAQSSKRVALVPNGTDFDFFHSAPSDEKLLASLPRPVVGYYGAIADWFDIQAVAEIAKQRPNYSLVIIGHVHSGNMLPLKSLPNVHFLGEKPYRDIPSYLRNFDACLIPFLVTKLTRAVDPVKLYEYLSQGKPVICSPMPELLQYDDIVYLASTPGQFVAQTDAALHDDSEALRQKRIDFARANTWAQRFETIDSAIRDGFPLVSLIVLTYNSAEFVRCFHDSVRWNGTYPNMEIIFVDNGSTDDTRVELEALATEDVRIRLVLLDRNTGFAAGNNIGVRESRGEFLAILNPDTILTRGSIERLLRPLRKDPSIGLTAPVTNFSGNQTRIGTTYRNCQQMEQFADHLALQNEGAVMDVPVVPLFCGVISRQLWDRLGGLDERYQVGMFEDDDFSLRVQQAGYRTVTAEDCFIHHFGNGSFSKLSSRASLRIFHENKQAFEAKWQRDWVPHKTRAGVQPPSPQDRLSLNEFFDGVSSSPVALPHLPEIHRLMPASTVAGESFHSQSDGEAALAVECSHATPDTIVLWSGTPLITAYGGPTLLTANVPASLYASSARVRITLLNHAGESLPAPFIVNGKRAFEAH
ncbi:MAG: glycosyltransferase [Bryobacteraceae bacterium]|nr:glycosyltransferase [Bryobacteraceae bacterium]